MLEFIVEVMAVALWTAICALIISGCIWLIREMFNDIFTSRRM